MLSPTLGTIRIIYVNENNMDLPPRRNHITGSAEWFSHLNMHQSHLEDLLQHRLLGLASRVSDSGGLWQCLRICICNEFPSNADADGLAETTGKMVENPQDLESTRPGSGL